MKRILILCLLPCLAFAGTKRVPVQIDPDTGLLYPRTVKGHVIDLPAGTTKDGSAIAGGGGSGTVTGITAGTGTTGLAVSITNPTTTPVLTIGGSLVWASLNKTGSSLADLANHSFSLLSNKPTTISGYGITDAQVKTGTLAIAGFGSITGRLPTANLPLGTRLYDTAGRVTWDFENRTGYSSSGTGVLGFDDAATGDKVRLGSVLAENLNPRGTTQTEQTTSYPIAVNEENFATIRDVTGRLMVTGEDSIAALAGQSLYIYTGAGNTITPVVKIWAGGAVTDDRDIFPPDASGTFALTANSTGVSDIAHGGTNATTQAAARTNLDAAPLHRTPNPQTGTDYTLLLTDDSSFLTMSNASANTVTVPTHASVAFATNSIIPVEQKGAGTTTFAPADGTVHIHSRGGLLSLAGQYSAASLTYEGSDVWLLVGDLQ